MEDSTEMKLVGRYMDLQQEVHSSLRATLANQSYLDVDQIEDFLVRVFDQLEDMSYPSISLKMLSDAGYNDLPTSYKDLRHV